MTEGFRCERRFNIGRNISIPKSWLMDDITDCLNGEDEQESKWEFCGNETENSKRIKSLTETCQNVYYCTNSHEKYVQLD